MKLSLRHSVDSLSFVCNVHLIQLLIFLNQGKQCCSSPFAWQTLFVFKNTVFLDYKNQQQSSIPLEKSIIYLLKKCDIWNFFKIIKLSNLPWNQQNKLHFCQNLYITHAYYSLKTSSLIEIKWYYFSFFNLSSIKKKNLNFAYNIPCYSELERLH